MRTMINYMAMSPSWTGPRPPRFLIWKEDIPRRPEILPRPIPPSVLDQLDPLLEEAKKALQECREPFLRRTVDCHREKGAAMRWCEMSLSPRRLASW